MGFKRRFLFLLAIGLCLFIACSKDPIISVDLGEREFKLVLPGVPYSYGNDTFPAHFNSPPLSFINSIQNPITNDGATLGRVLFYDRKLSANNAISCGSCHLQSKAFSDPAQFSSGFEGGKTGRNSMAIENTRYSFRFFWDHRATYVEGQVLMPIQNNVEM